MDEKELIKDIRWELSNKKSKADIIRKLQKKGLKLEFIESLISRANRPKKIFKVVLISFLAIFLFWFGVYGMFFYHSSEKVEYSPSWIKNQSSNDIAELEDSFYLEITPELISLVAFEMGAGKLKRNPLTLKGPTISFDISGENFYTTIDKKIQTERGDLKGADLKFTTTRETIEKIFLSNDFKSSIKDSVVSGEIEIKQIASEQDLFLKGYIGLYNELK